jgi:hypothetical protein
MTWIWSCMCLILLCNLKWWGERGINRPRKQTSCWAKPVESITIGWSDAMLFPTVGSSDASSCCLPPHMTVDTIHLTLQPTHHRFIRCWRLHDQSLTVSFLEVVGWAEARPSVHPVLKSSAPSSLCLDSLSHRIDRRCPHLDCRFILCYIVFCSFASFIHLTQLEFRPSVHPTVPVELTLHAVYQVLRR